MSLKLVDAMITCNEELYPPDVRRSVTTHLQLAVRSLAQAIPEIVADHREAFGLRADTAVLTLVDIGKFHVQSWNSPPLRVNVALPAPDRQLDHIGRASAFERLRSEISRIIQLEGLPIDWLLTIQLGDPSSYTHLARMVAVARS